MKVYISIPITGHDLDRQLKIADELKREIESRGHKTVSPFNTPAPPGLLTEKESYAYYMGADIQRLLLCDAICLADGWRDSKGCRLEYAAAKIYGIKILHLKINNNNNNNEK